jgi:hypothetical protein
MKPIRPKRTFYAIGSVSGVEQTLSENRALERRPVRVKLIEHRIGRAFPDVVQTLDTRGFRQSFAA